MHDLRHALRLLIKERSFTATVLLTLTVCLAANTAVLGIVRSVLMNPLPIPESERLVLLYNSYPHAGAARVGNAVPDYFDRRRDLSSLTELGLLRRESVILGDPQGAERLMSLRATPSFYRLARLEPVLGRAFSVEEGEPGGNDRVILGYGFWNRHFGGRRDVIGETIRLGGNPVTVVGVAPVDFVFVWHDIDVYLPAAFTPEERGDDRRHSNNWEMVGRMAPGASIDQVRQQVEALNAANNERFPEWRQILADAGYHTVVVGLQDDLVRDVRTVLYLLWGGVLFVLLIGCANIANLVLVRANARARELATRHAIGASLARLSRQLLTETTMLAAAGAALGIALGWWALRWVTSLELEQMPRSHEIGLDLAGVGLMLALTLSVGVAIGAVPALRLWRMNLNAELREEGRSGTGGRRARTARRALAVTQVAVAFVLLIGAGLLFASFRAVLGLDLGFDPAGVHSATVTLPGAAYQEASARVSFERRALEAIRAIPDVAAAGVTTALPFSGDMSNNVIMAEGYQMKPGESLLAPSSIAVGTGYFDAMRVRLVAGRYFEASDTADSTVVVIVDERLARRFYPDRNPVGRRLFFPSDINDVTRITENTRFLEIVGVVSNVQMSDPRADLSPVGTYYLPYAQSPAGTLTFAIRARTSSDRLMANVRQAIAGIDPALPLYRVRTMSAVIDEALTGRRVPMLLALAFGAIGLFLAAVGIYGVLAYGVAQRRRELGVRMALGGSARTVFGLVLRDGITIVSVGLALGLAGSYFVGQLMRSQLYDVRPMDPLVIGVVAAVLTFVALLASAIPSWRASRIDPTVVLSE